jgi:hypothetical protein
MINQPQLAAETADKKALKDSTFSRPGSSVSAMLQTIPTVSAMAVNQSFTAAANQFTTLKQFGAEGMHATSAEDRVRAAEQRRKDGERAFLETGTATIDPNGLILVIPSITDAIAAIVAKAKDLGYGSQSGSVPITGVSGGLVGRYSGNDIYAALGAKEAFEVHGDIRAKYESLGGAAGPLGLPTTNETVIPDNFGRFNHFEHGSIYWTPRTGPMMVRGTVRDRWAASGWERGPLGYPVQDQYRMRLLGPVPLVEWCLFENGLIAGDIRSALPAPMELQSVSETLGRQAPPALLTYAELGALFGNRFNEQFKASPDNVALRAGVTLTGVSDWQYGFWSSTPRSVGFRLHGFHDNGLAPDTNFVIDIRLRFQLIPPGPSFTEPITKTLIAVLDYLNVGQDGGLALAQVYATVDAAITQTFYSSDGNPPDPEHPEVPSGAIFVANVPTGADVNTGVINILDVLVTVNGDLQVLVNPLTPPQLPIDPMVSYTYERQFEVQDVLDSLT